MPTRLPRSAEKGCGPGIDVWFKSTNVPGILWEGLWRISSRHFTINLSTMRASCRRTDISELLQRDVPTPADAAKVSKAVYASPMNIQVPLQCHCTLHGSSSSARCQRALIAARLSSVLQQSQQRKSIVCITVVSKQHANALIYYIDKDGTAILPWRH